VGFDDFQKRRLRQARAQSAAKHAADNADITADEREEHHHARYRGGRWQTPVWAWTAGTWAQLLLLGVFWYGLGWWVYSDPTRHPTLNGILTIVAIVPAGILAVGTWSMLGQRWRAHARTFVKILPLVLVGLLLLTLLKSKPSQPDPAAKTTTSQGGDTATTIAASPRHTDKAATPQRILGSGSNAEVLALLGRLAKSELSCTRTLEQMRRVPTRLAKTTMEGQIECLQRLRGLQSQVMEAVRGRELKLADELATPDRARIRSALFALRYARPSIEALQLALAHVGDLDPEPRRLAVQALTRLGTEAPQLLRPHLMQAADSRLEAAMRAWVGIRLNIARNQNCETLTNFTGRQHKQYQNEAAARVAMRDVAPLCDGALEPMIRKASHPGDRFDRAAAASTLRYARIERYEQVQAWLQGLDDRLVQGAAAQALHGLAEEHFVREVGISALVLGHPKAMGTVPRPVVQTAPCAEGQIADLCPVKVEGGRELRSLLPSRSSSQVHPH